MAVGANSDLMNNHQEDNSIVFTSNRFVADVFPAFGMNPIPDKIPPTGNN